MSDAEELKQKLSKELAELQTMRDELKVKLHLAAADARDQWDALERKWERAQEELARVGNHAKEPLEEIGSATRGLVDELKKGYARVKEQLK